MDQQVKLQCGHYIYTTGYKLDPVKTGALRWCGECKGWRSIIKLTLDGVP